MFDELLSAPASSGRCLFAEPGLQAYEAANTAMLELADALVAVWDGQPAKDQGGTGVVVEQARRLG